MKILLIGIILILLSTLTGSSFDTIAKILSTNLFKWYHFYSFGISFGIFILLFFMIFSGVIKNHIILKKKENYIIPIIRGITFVPIPLCAFFALKNIDISIYTTLIMTMPFFVLIFSSIILNEKLNYISWLSVIFGFIGVILVLKPTATDINIFVLLPMIIAIYHGLNFVFVSKYSDKASPYGYTFYFFLPLTFFSFIFSFFDPIILNLKELFLVLGSGTFLMLSIVCWTSAFHIAGRYSSIISCFLFTQIIWAAIYGNILFSEKLDIVSIVGIIIIILAGIIALNNSNKIKIT